MWSQRTASVPKRGHTSICFRATQPLLFASKRDNLDSRMELDAKLLDSTSDREQRDGARTIVVATRRLQHHHVTPRSQYSAYTLTRDEPNEPRES